MEQTCVLALGFFDGVHLGHGALLRRTRELADRLGVPAAALTFDIHPDTLVYGHPVELLNTPEERAALMRGLYGIDRIFTLHFDAERMAQPWPDFVHRTLFDAYHVVYVVCGEDYRFGAHGDGTPERLAEACRERGAGCDCIPQVRLDGEVISSTLIRRLVAEGDMERAARLLGHSHRITGTVVHGRALGRTIGIPTANLPLQKGIVAPRFGVYASRVRVDGRDCPAVTNIGVRPTVSGSTPTVEPWLLDFDGDLYGRPLCVELLKFLRPERKFNSLDTLRAEILCNAAQTRALFAEKRV